MLDIHSDQTIYLQKPELILPERKSAKGPLPKRLKASTPDTTASKYVKDLKSTEWETIDIRHSAKGVLKGRFHFRTVYIWDKNINSVEERLLVVSSRKTKDGEDIKFSFSNANLAQYTEQAIAYMQAQRFLLSTVLRSKTDIRLRPIPDT